MRSSKRKRKGISKCDVKRFFREQRRQKRRQKNLQVPSSSESSSSSSSDSSSSSSEESVGNEINEADPVLPGTSLITLDQCIPKHLRRDIKSDVAFDVNKVYALLCDHIDSSDKDLVLVKLNDGKMGYRPAKESKKVFNIHGYLRAMFAAGCVYLKHRPSAGPAFLQYLFYILDADRDCTWSSVMKYDRQFRLYRQKHPNHSWANEIWRFCNELMAAKNLKSMQPANMGFTVQRRPNQQPLPFGMRSSKQMADFNTHSQQKSYSYPCKNFNNGSCSYPNCKFAHICDYCKKSGHGLHSCRIKNTSAGQNRIDTSGQSKTFGYKHNIPQQKK